MGKCRVLHVIASSRGGGAEVVRCLAKEMDRSRCVSTVVMPDDGGQLTAADLEAVGVSCQRFDIAGSFSPSEWWRLGSFIRRNQFDIVHCHGARAALWVRSIIGLQRRPCIVYSIHGLSVVHYRGIRRAVLLGIERLLRVVTDVTLCVSDSERAEVVRYGIASPERAHTVYNGIDLDRLDRRPLDGQSARTGLGLAAGEMVLLTVCRLDKPRDFDTLLLAAKRVVSKHPGVRLLIAGDGPLRTSVQKQVERLGLHEHVRLLGFVRDIALVLAAADVFVLSTQGWEGLPLAPLEAMAMRLPVVISDVGGNRSVVLDGVTGLVVSPRQPKALAAALLNLLHDRAAARQMGIMGRERVEHAFSAQRMAAETMEVYASLCPGRC